MLVRDERKFSSDWSYAIVGLLCLRGLDRELCLLQFLSPFLHRLGVRGACTCMAHSLLHGSVPAHAMQKPLWLSQRRRNKKKMNNDNNTIPMTTPTSTMTEVSPSLQSVAFRIRFNCKMTLENFTRYCETYRIAKPNQSFCADGVWETEAEMLQTNHVEWLMKSMNLEPIVQKAWIKQD